MRTPNSECCICKKPLYRRPSVLERSRYVACMEHRNEAQSNAKLTDSQIVALALGRKPGTNNRIGYVHSKESKRKTSESHKAWCAANPDKVKERGEKTRGANHYNWKGGVSRVSASIRQMNENRRWMGAVVQRDMRCLLCESEMNLEAHHVKPFAKIVKEHKITTREQARQCSALWDLSNGMTLCERCHCKHRRRKYTPTGNDRRKQQRKVRRTMVGTNNPNYRGGTVPLTCPQCGSMFQVKQSEVVKRKYCSRRCLGESQRKSV